MTDRETEKMVDDRDKTSEQLPFAEITKNEVGKVNTIQDQNMGPFAPISFEKGTHNFLFDTGSDHSLISWNLYEQVKDAEELKNCNIII